MHFEVAMAKIERFDAINQQLLTLVDAQILEVNDAMNTLACMLLDAISELSYDDADSGFFPLRNSTPPSCLQFPKLPARS